MQIWWPEDIYKLQLVLLQNARKSNAGYKSFGYLSFCFVSRFVVYSYIVWCSSYDTLNSKRRGSCSTVIVRDDSSLGATQSYAGMFACCFQNDAYRPKYCDSFTSWLRRITQLFKRGGDGYGYKDGVSFSKKRDVDRQASKPTKPTINSHMGHWILIGATQ